MTTSETWNGVDEVKWGAGEPLYHLEGLLRSLDGCEGEVVGAGVTSPVIAGGRHILQILLALNSVINCFIVRVNKKTYWIPFN